MLVRLEIRDFAVISNIVFEPYKGLNVISGETGAGKSLIVDAISLILGAKASRNLIRTGSPSAFAEAVFDCSNVTDEEFKKILSDNGIEDDDGMLIISRTVYDSGKSVARVNGTGVTNAILKDISSRLVDIHGQHDTQAIFDESTHVKLLDRFAGEKCIKLHNDYVKSLQEFKDLVLRIKEISSSPDYLERRRDYLEFAVNEIEAAGFKDGEEEELHETKKKLTQNEVLFESLKNAGDLLNTENNYQSPVQSVNQASRELLKASQSDESLKDIAERAQALALDLDALASDIDKVLTDRNYDEGFKERTEQRIGLLYELKAKYGASVSDINKFAADSKAELDAIEKNKDILQELKKQRTIKEKELLDLAEKLSSERKEYAKKLEKAITKELSDLEMPDAIFEVSFVRREKAKFFSMAGIDDISFRFSANPGQQVRALSAIVSGGEASRIMLAVKNVLSRVDLIPTLIFDEIDTGVSGKASLAIANKLKAIASAHQVLCVTHTAQIAAASDKGFVLTKKVSNGNTETVCTVLDGEGKTKEVSRLLSGSDTESSIRLAQDLIKSFGD
ncbi:DNA replication and repair protein RecN [Ruminococcaceae bacterium R-25]|nr:DNA replication and repair protein RecN [Ruminococcaceae bacterium R-25]SUQ11087.1 DNA replication and repair protein RecN [Oscillospiraceae bacterium]